MRLLAAINQVRALFSAGSRGSNGGVEATKLIRSDQLRLQKVNISYNDLQYHHHHPHTLDPSNLPDTCESDPIASIHVHPELKPRQAVDSITSASACGYLNGNASQPRTANSGYDCRFDTKNAIWGFCPTTISIASDCGLAGGCVDAHACATGCGITDELSVTVFTWFVNLLTSAICHRPSCINSALVLLVGGYGRRAFGLTLSKQYQSWS